MLIEYLGFFVEARRVDSGLDASSGSRTLTGRARAGGREMSAEDICGAHPRSRSSSAPTIEPTVFLPRSTLCWRRPATSPTKSSSSTTTRLTTPPRSSTRSRETPAVACVTRSSRVRGCRTDETPGSRSRARPSSRSPTTTCGLPRLDSAAEARVRRTSGRRLRRRPGPAALARASSDVADHRALVAACAPGLRTGHAGQRTRACRVPGRARISRSESRCSNESGCSPRRSDA